MQPNRLFTVSIVLALLLIAGCQEEKPSMDNVTGPEEGQGTTEGDMEGPDGLLKSDGSPKAVYTLSNEPGGNRVIRFKRAGNGSLSPAGSFPTGGAGTGGGLGSQGALALEHGLLFAVNAGSNEISVLSAKGVGLQVVSRVPSGGVMPISLTVHGDLLYVLNAGSSGNITGFTGARKGNLIMLQGSTRPLSNGGVGPAPGPAQVSFSPDRRTLLVTEKATNLLDTYNVDAGGYASGPQVHPSAGSTPFGFAFTRRGYAIVSEAFGGAPGAGAMSSYATHPGGGLSLISGSVANSQTAPCWVVVTNNSRFAYTTNTGTNNISGYYVNQDGSLTLFNDGGATAPTDGSPIDMDLSQNSQYLYTLNASGHSITYFRVNMKDGSLTPQGSVGGLPPAAVGLAAR